MIRPQISMTSALLALSLSTACGKKSGGGGESPQVETQKPGTELTPPPSSTEPTDESKTPETPDPKPGEQPKPDDTRPPVDPLKPKPEDPKPSDPNKPAEPKPTTSTSLLKGLWGLSIAQKPNSCSSFYDLRDDSSVYIHVLCSGDAGKSIFLQTETLSRTSDDGKAMSLKRTASTCPSSPTVTPLVRFNYSVESSGKLLLTEGSRPSPELLPVDPSNYAEDLRTAATVHGRPIVRGCFRTGNLQVFDKARRS